MSQASDFMRISDAEVGERFGSLMLFARQRVPEFLKSLDLPLRIRLGPMAAFHPKEVAFCVFHVVLSSMTAGTVFNRVVLHISRAMPSVTRQLLILASVAACRNQPKGEKPHLSTSPEHASALWYIENPEKVGVGYAQAGDVARTKNCTGRPLPIAALDGVASLPRVSLRYEEGPRIAFGARVQTQVVGLDGFADLAAALADPEPPVTALVVERSVAELVCRLPFPVTWLAPDAADGLLAFTPGCAPDYIHQWYTGGTQPM
jgi:hypothetical protein